MESGLKFFCPQMISEASVETLTFNWHEDEKTMTEVLFLGEPFIKIKSE